MPGAGFPLNARRSGRVGSRRPARHDGRAARRRDGRSAGSNADADRGAQAWRLSAASSAITRRFQPQYPTRVQSPASATTRGPAATTGAACLCSVSEFTTPRGLGRGLRFLPRPYTYLMLSGDDFAPGRRWHHPGLTQHGVNSRIAGSRPRERRSPSSCHYVHRRSPLLG